MGRQFIPFNLLNLDTLDSVMHGLRDDGSWTSAEGVILSARGRPPYYLTMASTELPITAIEIAAPRPMPVIVVADNSTSMQGQKIEAVNGAVREMCSELGRIADPRMRAYFGMIRFGGNVEEVLVPTPASEVTPPVLSVSGNTPMGAAFMCLRDLLERKDYLPVSSYSPTIVLVSDGHPTDNATGLLDQLLDSPRMRKATRLAMAIGGDADHEILRRFVGTPEIPVFLARDVHKIHDFFQWVTFSVQVRSRSRMPDLLIAPPTDDLDDDDLLF